MRVSAWTAYTNSPIAIGPNDSAWSTAPTTPASVGATVAARGAKIARLQARHRRARTLRPVAGYVDAAPAPHPRTMTDAEMAEGSALTATNSTRNSTAT
jgi:hypothetical protein